MLTNEKDEMVGKEKKVGVMIHRNKLVLDNLIMMLHFVCRCRNESIIRRIRRKVLSSFHALTPRTRRRFPSVTIGGEMERGPRLGVLA